jgi:hypothetical protein
VGRTNVPATQADANNAGTRWAEFSEAALTKYLQQRYSIADQNVIPDAHSAPQQSAPARQGALNFSPSNGVQPVAFQTAALTPSAVQFARNSGMDPAASLSELRSKQVQADTGLKPAQAISASAAQAIRERWDNGKRDGITQQMLIDAGLASFREVVAASSKV